MLIWGYFHIFLFNYISVFQYFGYVVYGGYFCIFLLYLLLSLCLFGVHSDSKHSEQYYMPNGNMRHRQWLYPGHLWLLPRGHRECNWWDACSSSWDGQTQVSCGWKLFWGQGISISILPRCYNQSELHIEKKCAKAAQFLLLYQYQNCLFFFYSFLLIFYRIVSWLNFTFIRPEKLRKLVVIWVLLYANCLN